MRDTIASRVKRAHEIVKSPEFRQRQAAREHKAFQRRARQLDADKSYQKRMLNGRKAKAGKSSVWAEDAE